MEPNSLGMARSLGSDTWGIREPSTQRRSVSLKEEEQFVFAERVPLIQQEENGGRVFFDNETLEMAQRSFNPEYVSLYDKAENSKLFTLQLTPQGKVAKIIGFVPPDTLATVIDLTEDLPLKEEIRRHLQLPKVTPEMKLGFQREQEAKEKFRKRLAQLIPEKPSSRRRMEDREDAVQVLQKEAGITRADRPHRYLKTFAAGPCIILTLHHAGTKIGALSHLDHTTDVKKALELILTQMSKQGAEAKGMKAGLIGGHKGQSETFLLAIADSLEEQHIPITKVDVLGIGPTRVKSVIMDTKSGEIFDLVPRQQDRYFHKKPDHQTQLIAGSNETDIRFVVDPNGL